MIGPARGWPAAGLLAATALALAGCGGTAGPAPTAAASTAGAAAPSSAPAPTKEGIPGGAITSPPAAGVGNAGEMPAGFPLPPGTRVGPVAVGKKITATLTVANGKQVYDYWRRQLPAAGYTISGSQMVGGIGEITFSGRDCGAGSQLGISDQDVTFECARS